jgi:tight adherence protein B
MMAALVALSATACLFLFLVYLLRARALRSPEVRIQRLSPSRDVSVESGAGGASVLKRTSSSIPALSRWLNTRGYAERWAFELERANLSLRPGEYFLIRLLLAVTVGAIVALIGRNAIAVAVAIPLGAMVYMLPAQWLKLRTQRRLRKINAQLVETISLITNGVRAGFAFGQSVDVAAKRIGPPISVELNRMLLDINLGGSTEEALSAMNERIGSDDVDMLVTAILIQRSSGGNLAEILELIAETMRDRERIHGEIKTLTSSQQLTGWILSLWPAALALGFFAINPSAMSLLWTTSAGLVLLGLWFTLNTLGIFSIRRILDIDV